MKKKTFVASCLLAAAMMAGTVMAEEATTAVETTVYTSEDGVLSLNLPKETWVELEDPSSWFALTDGLSMITIDHLSNGEELPATVVADDHYVNIYQVFYSTQNEVFVITGEVADTHSTQIVKDAISSVEILKYDTKKAIKKDEASASGYGLNALDKTMYVTSDGLNVRAACTTESEIIGGFGYGDGVHVTGEVTVDGKTNGWYQIEYSGGKGFVAGAFLSDSKPGSDGKQDKKPASIVRTGRVRTVYWLNGNGTTIYQYSDYTWYDEEGVEYYGLDDQTWTNSNGETLYNYIPDLPVDDRGAASKTGNTITLYWGNSNTITLYEYSNGEYYSDEYVEYVSNADGTWSGSDGTTLYEYDPIDSAIASGGN